MNIEVRLPELGDGIESGDVLEVLVAVGDQVAKDQGVIEIETDKATVEVPSSGEGKVAEVHVSAGQTISIGELLSNSRIGGVRSNSQTGEIRPRRSTTADAIR